MAATLIPVVVVAWSPFLSISSGALGAPHTLRLEWYKNLGALLQKNDADSVSHYRSLIADDGPEQADLARYLREHTLPTDLIQIWGPEPGIYYAAGRFWSSRLLTERTLLCLDKDNPNWLGGKPKFVDECETRKRLPMQLALKDEFVQNAAVKKRPRYIVAHYTNGSLAIAEGCMACYAPDFPELRAIIDQKYVLEATFGKWSVFRSKTDRSPTALKGIVDRPQTHDDR